MKPTLQELDEAFKIADKTANLVSSDSQSKVGAGIFNFNKIAMVASNTFVNGAVGLPDTRPDKYQYIIHAEANLIYEAARLGIPLDKKIVICTLSPCQNCIRTMFQAGIREVYYRDLYPAHNTEMRDIKVIETKYGEYTYMVLTNYE
jgi:dCMP deaminase